MTAAVVDSSALLAVINAEPGAERATAWLDGASISAVNHAEVMTKLVEMGLPREVARLVVQKIGIQVLDYDVNLADRTGELRMRTKHLGLSLADRACLALAERERAFVVTADRSWAKADLDLDIRLIR